MDPSFWITRWELGQTGFHRDGPHPDLLAFEEQFLGGGPHRVLVPLCGKSHDLAWLADRGHQVVGVELSPVAIDAVFDGVQTQDDRPGPFLRRREGHLTCLIGDVFALTPELVGPVDRIWDRAALVALDPPRRAPYAATLRRLLRPGGLLLQNKFAYDQHKMEGPPFSVSDDELLTCYAGWRATCVRRDQEPLEQRFVDRGLAHWEGTTWLFEAPEETT